MTTTNPKLHDLTMQLHHDTGMAVLVSETGDEKKAVWLPRSQVEVEVIKGNIVEVTLPEWLAKEKGLI